MPQLHLYLPKDLADEVRRRAEARQLSTSAFLAELVRKQISPGWPEGYFENVVGSWQGEPLTRPPQGAFEDRESW